MYAFASAAGLIIAVAVVLSVIIKKVDPEELKKKLALYLYFPILVIVSVLLLS